MSLRTDRVRGGGGHRAGRRVQLLDLRQARLPPLVRAARAAAPRHAAGRPRDLVRAEQWPTVEATLQAAVARLSRASGSHVHRVEALRDWLLAQGCVEQVSAPIRGAGGVNAVLMLTADPALVPIQITFRTEEQRPAT